VNSKITCMLASEELYKEKDGVNFRGVGICIRGSFWNRSGGGWFDDWVTFSRGSGFKILTGFVKNCESTYFKAGNVSLESKNGFRDGC